MNAGFVALFTTGGFVFVVLPISLVYLLIRWKKHNADSPEVVKPFINNRALIKTLFGIAIIVSGAGLINLIAYAVTRTSVGAAMSIGMLAGGLVLAILGVLFNHNKTLQISLLNGGIVCIFYAFLISSFLEHTSSTGLMVWFLPIVINLYAVFVVHALYTGHFFKPHPQI